MLSASPTGGGESGAMASGVSPDRGSPSGAGGGFGSALRCIARVKAGAWLAWDQGPSWWGPAATKSELRVLGDFLLILTIEGIMLAFNN